MGHEPLQFLSREHLHSLLIAPHPNGRNMKRAQHPNGRGATRTARLSPILILLDEHHLPSAGWAQERSPPQLPVLGHCLPDWTTTTTRKTQRTIPRNPLMDCWVVCLIAKVAIRLQDYTSKTGLTARAFLSRLNEVSIRVVVVVRDEDKGQCEVMASNLEVEVASLPIQGMDPWPTGCQAQSRATILRCMIEFRRHNTRSEYVAGIYSYLSLSLSSYFYTQRRLFPF